MFSEFGGNRLVILRIANFLLGGAYDMQCESCSAQWGLYVYRVSYEYEQVCVSYTSSFQTVF